MTKWEKQLSWNMERLITMLKLKQEQRKRRKRKLIMNWLNPELIAQTGCLILFWISSKITRNWGSWVDSKMNGKSMMSRSMIRPRSIKQRWKIFTDKRSTWSSSALKPWEILNSIARRELSNLSLISKVLESTNSEILKTKKIETFKWTILKKNWWNLWMN
jgi:hypothetical protein